MSYILDALVQSERARSDGVAAQRFSLLPVLADDAPPQQHAWQYGLLAGLLLLNAAVLYTRLRPLPQAPVATPVATAVAATVAARVDRVPIPAPAVAPPTPAAAAAPPAAVPRAAATPRVLPAPAAAAVAARAARPAATADAPAHGTPRADPDQMPPEIQKQLPPLAVAGYIRDADNNDLVMVNDRLLHAGDEVEPGLRLEKIAADGLVFSFKGYRFKR